MILWVIWEQRNERTFRDKCSNREELWDRAVYLSLLWVSILKKFVGMSYFSVRNNWEALVGKGCVGGFLIHSYTLSYFDQLNKLYVSYYKKRTRKKCSKVAMLILS